VSSTAIVPLSPPPTEATRPALRNALGSPEEIVKLTRNARTTEIPGPCFGRITGKPEATHIAKSPLPGASGRLAWTSRSTDAVGFALIAHDKPLFICPSDGTSCAVITRISAASPDGKNVINKRSWEWRMRGEDRRPSRFTLWAGEARTTSVTFHLPKGSYEFLAGYGGGVHSGPCVAFQARGF
jgi:hypothetical protein